VIGLHQHYVNHGSGQRRRRRDHSIAVVWGHRDESLELLSVKRKQNVNLEIVDLTSVAREENAIREEAAAFDELRYCSTTRLAMQPPLAPFMDAWVRVQILLSGSSW
jgi:hypothetical protein